MLRSKSTLVNWRPTKLGVSNFSAALQQKFSFQKKIKASSHCAAFCWRQSSPSSTRFLRSNSLFLFPFVFPHMNSLNRIAKFYSTNKNRILELPLQIKQSHFDSSFHGRALSSKSFSPTSGLGKFGNGDDEWNDTWESAWLPEDLLPKNKAPWESDVNFPSGNPTVVLPSDVDSETKAFVEDMNENWTERRKANQTPKQGMNQQEKEGDGDGDGDGGGGGSLYSLENIKKDYRLNKQRIHANLWMKEIEKQEEARLGDSITGSGDDIERLMDSCSEIFESVNDDLNHSKVPSSSEFRNKPDGWETTSKGHDGNVWEMTQREEDILLQEFDRRIAYNKFQIASFIKTHIFSRRRPIDGWKYMIEEFGPNAKKGKGSVSRLPSLSDPSTQPFKEEKVAASPSLRPLKRM